LDALSLVAHVFIATLAFGLAIAFDFVLIAIAKSRDVRVIRTVYEKVSIYSRWVGPLFGIAILLGFGLAGERHEPLWQPWLRVTYVLIILGFIAIGLARRRYTLILAAARNAGDSVTPELEKAIAGASPIIAWSMLVLMITLITVMFLKPFSG